MTTRIEPGQVWIPNSADGGYRYVVIRVVDNYVHLESMVFPLRSDISTDRLVRFHDLDRYGISSWLFPPDR